MLDETNALPETNIANENGCLENKLLLISINFTPKTSLTVAYKNGTFLCVPVGWNNYDPFLLGWPFSRANC